MLVTVVVCGVFYLLVAYAATIGFGASRTAELWGGDPLGLAHLADRDVGSGLGAAIEVAVIVDVLAVLLALVNALGRVAFGLRRDARHRSTTSPRSRWRRRSCRRRPSSCWAPAPCASPRGRRCSGRSSSWDGVPALGIHGTLHPLPDGAARTGAVAGAVLAGGVAVAVVFLRARRATTVAAAGRRAAIAQR